MAGSVRVEEVALTTKLYAIPDGYIMPASESLLCRE
jgi:hypothetical protein